MWVDDKIQQQIAKNVGVLIMWVEVSNISSVESSHARSTIF